MKRLWISSSLILFTFACSDRNLPEDVAEDFIYNYYLRANQKAALRLSAALAEEKLKSEIELLRDVRQPGEAPEAQPKIKYKMIGKKIYDESVVRLKNGTEIIGVVEGNEDIVPTTVTIKTRDGETMTISGGEVDRVVEQKRVFFRYRLIIKDAESSIPSRNAVLYTELINGHWKVVNFDEY
jgi:small nuclear ribonucleoprotein (snRNP)-like protein